jgi:ESCRT-II complex subunit VPS36
VTSPSRSATSSPARGDSPFHLPPSEPAPANNATWVCPICFFSNPVPSNFDPSTASAHTPLAPCLTCGVKPPLAHILKAAIAGATKRPTQTTAVRSPVPIRARTEIERPRSEVYTNSMPGRDDAITSSSTYQSSDEALFPCPRCTYLNHPSLLACELCGAPLISQDLPDDIDGPQPRAESPGPMLQTVAAPGVGAPESIKISFRGGGEKIFHERLKGAMTQRKWLLQGAPPVPRPNLDNDNNDSGSSTPTERVKTVGIAGLEQRRLDLRKNNELVIGSAFEDLEALMASAKDIVALAETFARQTNGTASGNSEANALLAQSASALGLVTTKDMLGGGSSSETLYLSELSRNLAEFLTDDARGVLRKAGGIISLVDLWAIFNRARGGVELVSPNDFEKAARLWEKLKLPVRLRQFRSGVLVVQASDRTDQKTIKTLMAWLKDLHEFPPDKETSWDWRLWGRGVTAQDAAERFGWSIGVATEELEMAEESGNLCREEGIEGLRWWENWITKDSSSWSDTAVVTSAAEDISQGRLQSVVV